MNDAGDALPLEASDLVDMEDRLCRLLGDFLEFTGHALYFPVENFPDEAEILPGEKRLILPLSWNGSNLGVIMLDGIKVGETRRLLPHLPAIARLCLENLGMARAARYEKSSGLLNEAALFEKMETEAAALRAMLEDPGRIGGGNLPLHRLCLGLVVLRLNRMKPRQDDFYERYFMELAKACAAGAPSDVLCARLGMHEGRYEIGMLFSATGRGICQKLARDSLAELHKVNQLFADEGVSAIISAGHALYPQDMAGHELTLPIFEQARRLRNRARLAAIVAVNARYGSVSPVNLNMPFSRILLDGGIVLETLPGGRIKTSLGRESNAVEGMRFQIHARGGDGQRGALKGELVILEAHERHSIAELLYLEDAAVLPLPGDNLVKVGASRPEDGDMAPLPVDGAESGFFVRHGEFLCAFGEARAHTRKFALSIARMGSAANFDALLEDFEKIIKEAEEDDLLAGRYGSNSVIFFHPCRSAAECVGLYEKLAQKALESGADFAAGVAEWPFLDFDRGEMEDCALKALEYGILLPAPHIGIFGSLALNISADRRYSLGDIFGAIGEYRKALLADPENAMARNSLGVCMTTLNRHAEAKRLFLDACRQAQDNALAAKICYNLGAVAKTLGETRGALRHWRRCAALAPEHGYAWIRLGQLYEELGRKGEARASFEKASENDDPVVAGTARRHLASLARRQKNDGAARELLHDALLANPADASAMLMLAGLYLEDREDPTLVELLARKSAALTDRPEAWKMLAEALRRLGREDEARGAELNARLKASETGLHKNI